MPTCKALTSGGQPCQSQARLNMELCFFHDPESQQQRRTAQQKGGSKGLRLLPMANPPGDFDLSDPQQISKLLSHVSNRVVRGELDPKCAYALGYLADCALRAHNAVAVTERIERLERLQEAERDLPVDPRLDFFEDEDSGATAADPAQGPART